eukprot:gene1737-2397_t
MSNNKEYGLPRVRELSGSSPTNKPIVQHLQSTGGCVSSAAHIVWDGLQRAEKENKKGGSGGDTGGSCVAANKNDKHDSSLQQQVNVALDGAVSTSSSALNSLACALAKAGETAALVRVWDALGGSQGASPATWLAVEALHARGKDRIPNGTLRLPALSARALAPARRLHKICKGRRMSARSAGVQDYIANGLAWVAAQRVAGRSLDAGSGRARSIMAKELRKALSINLETARGLVTTLKRKKAF